MINCRDDTDPSVGSNLPQPPRADPLPPGFVWLEDYPELIPVLTRAVDEAIASSHINRERDADLIEDVERAAAASALATYKRMAVSASQASDAANRARRARAHSVAVSAEVIAERVTDAAAEVHNAEEASADHLALAAANAAFELAESVRFDDETAVSTAAALVVRAISDAAAVNTSARADAASSVVQAAADAAADIAGEAASTASAAAFDVIADASDRQRDALETCYEVAAATAHAVLTHQSGVHLRPRHHHPPEVHKKPA